MGDDPEVSRISCPNCGSDEFVIEETRYQASWELWVRCRQCDWTIGELPKINTKTCAREIACHQN
jgi:uncharacterized Zn finger protein